ncbi:hypothetical protein ACMAZE_12635 [Pseudopelagicola sp. nBUS_20]|uniref:hypothetical protein n=1 Tax=Pseudopelagicola sp. nBUS_20 TaxID=3395317 RepID=UPI003EBED230
MPNTAECRFWFDARRLVREGRMNAKSVLKSILGVVRLVVEPAWAAYIKVVSVSVKTGKIFCFRGEGWLHG